MKFVRFQLGVMGLLIFVTSSGVAAKSKVSETAMELSIDEYVRTVLNQGEKALTAYNNFQNSTLGYKVSYRQTRMPTMSLTSSISKSKSEVDVDTSSVVHTEDANGSLSLNQPIYVTGAKLSASYNESQSKTESVFGTTHSTVKPSYSATLTQPLYLFVGNTDWRSWKKTTINFSIARDNYKREIQTIENDARAQYYDVILKREQLEVEKTKLESSRRSFKITQALVDAGRLAGIELARSEVKYQTDVRRLKNAEFSLQQTVNQALDFASLKYDSPVEFTSKLDYTHLTLTLDALMRFAFANRPDYLAAKQQLELSELSIVEALEANNPTLNAVGSMTQTTSGSDTRTSESKNWTGTLNVSWPFFDSRITALNAQVARNNLENSKISFKNLERSIQTDVSNAFLDVKRSEEQLDDLKKSRQQAKHSVEAVRIRYQNGRDRLIDVFDSEQELRDLELEFLNIIITANLAKEKLALLIGGTLKDVKNESR